MEAAATMFLDIEPYASVLIQSDFLFLPFNITSYRRLGILPFLSLSISDTFMITSTNTSFRF